MIHRFVRFTVAVLCALSFVAPPLGSALAKSPVKGLTSKKVPISKALNKALKKTKKKANLKKLKKIYKKVNGIPAVKTKAGTFLLNKLSLDTKLTSKQKSDAKKLSKKLNKYKKYIDGKSGAEPPSKVKLNKWMTKIKHQGDRGTCVAFASMAALEFAYRTQKGKKINLSEQHAFRLFKENISDETCCDGGLKTTDSAAYLKDNKVSTEKDWKYVKRGKKLKCPISESSHRTLRAKNNAKYGIQSFTILDRDNNLLEDEGIFINNPKYLESILAAGYPIVLGVHVTSDWSTPKGVIDVTLDENGDPLESIGGHAIVLTGYKQKKKNSYFRAKNSWGIFKGHGGYVRLSYDYIRTYAKYGYYITAVR